MVRGGNFARRGEAGQLGEEATSVLRRKIVQADVEESRAVRDGPFQRDRDVAALLQDAQVHGRVDVVVIGERDERLQAEALLDLVALELPGFAGASGGRPPDAFEVNRRAMRCGEARFQALNGEADGLAAFAEAAEEAKRLLGMESVTVERDASPELAGGGSGPLQVNFALFHDGKRPLSDPYMF